MFNALKGNQSSKAKTVAMYCGTVMCSIEIT